MAPAHVARQDVGGLRLRDGRDDLRRVRRALQAALPDDRPVDRPRRRARGRRAARRPVRVAAQARHGREGQREPCSAATAACSTASTRCSSPRRPPTSRSSRSPPSPGHTVRMTRVALLGATGSIGRQAIEVIEASPALELVAAASGSTPIDGLAPLTQVGGDPTELLERAAPDIVLNATSASRACPRRCGRSSTGSRSRSRTRRASSPRASLALAARERGGGAAHPGRQRALGALPVRAARRARERRPDRERRPVPRPHARRARRRDSRGGARASDLVDGREDHDRLGDAREQGARGDRGALPLRDCRTTASRSSCIRRRSSTASSVSATARRSPTSATRTCACRSRTR